jgi:hypothetical protein
MTELLDPNTLIHTEPLESKDWKAFMLSLDIEKNGQLQPICLRGKHVVDGHHRLLATRQLGLSVLTFQQYPKEKQPMIYSEYKDRVMKMAVSLLAVTQLCPVYVGSDNVIFDGALRAKACQLLGLDLVCRSFEGKVYIGTPVFKEPKLSWPSGNIGGAGINGSMISPEDKAERNRKGRANLTQEEEFMTIDWSNVRNLAR